MRCKTSKDCDGDETCDRKVKQCRDKLPKGPPPLPLSVYKKRCTTKMIPLIYEAGPRKGTPKEKPALRRCKYQKSRLPTTETIMAMNYDACLSLYKSLLDVPEFQEFMSRRKRTGRPPHEKLKKWLTDYLKK